MVKDIYPEDKILLNMNVETISIQQLTEHHPLVSVIVPIYNAEKTIHKCLDSLLAQTFQEYEILLIDDGSPDRCGEICDEYAEQDKRVRVIHQVNQGVSAARQCGINHARGEYTIHADPDDWVEPTMLEDLYGKAKEGDADMVICDFFENTYKGQKYIKQEPTSSNSYDVLRDVFFRIHGSLCNKLIRRSLFYDYEIQFPRGISFCEDQYTVAAILKNDIKVSYLHQAFYHYVRDYNTTSLTKYYDDESYQQDLFRRKLFDDLLKDNDICKDVFEKNSYSIVSHAFFYGSQYYNSRSFRDRFETYKETVKKTSVSKYEKVLVYISCCGYYRIALSFLKSVLYFKHRLCK